MRKFLSISLVAAFGTMATSAFGWVDLGHMVIAEIAWRSLTPKVRAECRRLLLINTDPRSADFVTAACWADDTKTRRTARWHYVDHHFRSDGSPTNNLPDAENVETQIAYFSQVLSHREESDKDRGIALRYLLHLIGDIHQPLHCSSRDSDQYPLGDRGGNLFVIAPPSSLEMIKRLPKNLHALWDLGGGLLAMHVARPLSSESQMSVSDLADQVLLHYPPSRLKGPRIDDPSVWAAEGLALSQTLVYPLTEHGAPGNLYLKRVVRASSSRLSIAGFRLAQRLNRLLN